MPIHLRDQIAVGGHVPGILILDPSMSLGETCTELAMLHGASAPDEHIDQILYLPLSS